MVVRISLFVASLTAAFALAAALSLAGLGPTAGPGDAPAATALSQTASVPAAPVVQVDTVYIPAPVAPTTVVVHQVAPAANGGENESENDGG
jgi:hypothetical protein